MHPIDPRGFPLPLDAGRALADAAAGAVRPPAPGAPRGSDAANAGAALRATSAPGTHQSAALLTWRFPSGATTVAVLAGLHHLRARCARPEHRGEMDRLLVSSRTALPGPVAARLAAALDRESRMLGVAARYVDLHEVVARIVRRAERA